MAQPASPPKSFESAVSELESIVREMESGTISLEQALEQYQRGMGLLKFCQETLANAEQRVRLLEGEDLKPFPADSGQGTP